MTAPIPTALDAAVPLSDDDVKAYRTLGTDAVWWDFPLHWSTFRGDKAAEALNGLVTNDVLTLAPGQGHHAAALSPKGKLVADLLIFRLDQTGFLVGTVPEASVAWLELARKYINPRLCKVHDESGTHVTWAICGAQAAEALVTLSAAGASDAGTSAATPNESAAALTDWENWHHGSWSLGPTSVRVIRAPIVGAVPAFMVLADSPEKAAQVEARFSSAPLPRGSRALWHVMRIEAGLPLMGVDMNDTTIPQEANLDTLGAISFTKGCYTGQETVARIHFRGHVNRHLRGLMGEQPMSTGASVVDQAGKTVGDVRSAAISPLRGPIAMAMLRREVPVGDSVFVQGTAPTNARVVELPFQDQPGAAIPGPPAGRASGG